MSIPGPHFRTDGAIFHHPALSGRIIGSVVVDEHHLTAGRLLALARQYHRGPAARALGTR